MVVTRRRSWLQWDGSTGYTAVRARKWLEGNFDDRVNSWISGRPWPSCAPDMSFLNYRLWSVCMAKLRRRLSVNLEELIATEEEYKDSLKE